MTRRYAALGFMLALALASPRGPHDQFVHSHLVLLVSAITIATADGSPLSGCWS